MSQDNQDQKRAHYELYKAFKGKVFDSDFTPKRHIQEAGGVVLSRPAVPMNWKVKIIPHFGLKYFNPDDNEEWVKVNHGNPKCIDAVYKSAHLIYHKPLGIVKKPFRKLIPFDLNEHGHVLAVLRKSYGDQSECALAAYDLLKDYSFKLEDIVVVRRQLGFEDLSKDALLVLKEKICECHATNISQSQAGVMFKHKANHYFAARFAKHIGQQNSFIKLQTDRGYHTVTGAKTLQNMPEAHISVEHLLDISIEWYSPPCEKVFSLNEFDYYRDIKHEDSASSTQVYAELTALMEPPSSTEIQM